MPLVPTMSPADMGRLSFEKGYYMDRWELPELYCPFPPLVNRNADTVEQRTIEWAAQQGLLTDPVVRKRLERVRVGWLIARTYPDTALDELQLLADWCTWLFLQDDQCDEKGIGKDPVQLAGIHNRSLAVLKGAPTHQKDRPLTFALTDLRRRLLERARPGWMARFLQTVADAFDASVWEAGNRARNSVPSVEQYLAKRPYTGGLYTLVEMVELTENLNLPFEIYDHPYIQKLTRRAVNAVCFSNDVISLAKELKQGDFHNLVVVLCHKDNISLQDAVYRVAALHDAEVRAFINLELDMPSFGPAFETAVKQYVRILKAWMRGNLDWSYMSGRYLLAQLALDGG